MTDIKPIDLFKNQSVVLRRLVTKENVNFQDEYSNTALYYAVKELDNLLYFDYRITEMIEMIEILLDAGADMNIQYRDYPRFNKKVNIMQIIFGIIPTEIPEYMGDSESDALIERYYNAIIDLLKIFIHHGFDINQTFPVTEHSGCIWDFIHLSEDFDIKIKKFNDPVRILLLQNGFDITKYYKHPLLVKRPKFSPKKFCIYNRYINCRDFAGSETDCINKLILPAMRDVISNEVYHVLDGQSLFEPFITNLIAHYVY